jgi:hypothetical protein
VYRLLPKMHNQLQAIAASLAGAAGLLLGAGSASAVTIPTVPVLVNGTTYNVTYFEGTYNDNSSRFTTAEMPWFGDETLATTFASAVEFQLGKPYLSVSGPFFAYQLVGADSVFVKNFTGTTGTRSAFKNDAVPYATLAPAPVPAPLPLFGAAAAFSATRRLRSMSRTLHRSTTAGA